MHLRSLTLIIFLSIIKNEILSQTPTFNSFFFGKNAQQTDVTPINLTSLGKHYADLNWNTGNVYLSNGDSLIAYYLRYDLVRNHLEIIVDTKIKAINGSFISSFEWFNTAQLKPEMYTNKQMTSLREISDISGFVEILEDGVFKLYKSRLIFIPEQATSPTLVNNTDNKNQILIKYYLEKSDQLFEVVNSKRKNFDFLDSTSLKEFVKNENLKFNNENDLIKIIQFANK